MADAMAYVIFKEGLQDQDFMDKYCIGFDEDHMPEGIPYGESYRSYLFGVKDGVEKTPQWAEQICGVPAETIRELAIEYATVKPAALLPGYSVQRTLTGEQACRGFIALALSLIHILFLFRVKSPSRSTPVKKATRTIFILSSGSR